MRSKSNLFGIYLVMGCALLLAAACELDENGDADATDDTTAPTCVADGFCDPACAPGVDPDCVCECDRNSNYCSAAAPGSTAPCSCDPNCTASALPCTADGWADPWCRNDPDCTCDFNDDVCEPAQRNSTTPCLCDLDCLGGAQPCVLDAHCDSWCPDGTDPDCGVDCYCNYFSGICEADARNTDRPCGCDPACAGVTQACREDNHCDTWCTIDGICKDPDCSGTRGSGYLSGACVRN